MTVLLPTLWAVHISANVLAAPWWLLGFVAMAGLMIVGARRLREDELPRIALLTSAFFVASQLHIPLGPVTVHLLLCGLVGLVLGRRACLAIPVGVLLQAVLLGHGDLTTVGINSCIMIVPALLAAPLFHIGGDATLERPGEGLVAVACVLFPWSVVALCPTLIGLRHVIRHARLEPVWRGGFVVGSGSVMVAVLLQALVLVMGGAEDWRVVALLSVIGHVPVALVEGVIVGFTSSFLARVRPDLLAAVSLHSGQADRGAEGTGPTSEANLGESCQRPTVIPGEAAQ